MLLLLTSSVLRCIRFIFDRVWRFHCPNGYGDEYSGCQYGSRYMKFRFCLPLVRINAIAYMCGRISRSVDFHPKALIHSPLILALGHGHSHSLQHSNSIMTIINHHTQQDAPDGPPHVRVSSPHPAPVQTQYMRMLLALDAIPRVDNLLACFFTWLLLAGFVLFPGTFATLQSIKVDDGVDGIQQIEAYVLHAVHNVPL